MTDVSRASLLTSKLVALARAHLGALTPSPAEFPGGGALVAGDQAWVLLEDDPVTRFGPALVWADRQGAAEVHLVVAADVAGIVARRASCFAPAPYVWGIEGTGLVPVRYAAGDWTPPAAPPAPELAELLVDADLEVLVEDGIVRGEVQGLEVARIVHGTTSTGEPIDEPILEVGVGQADRELTGMLHAGLSPIAKLARVAEIVRAHRTVGAEPHPLNQLVPERWLRARLIADPGRIGLRELRPAAAAVPRSNLRDKGVAMAQGARDDGSPVVVACSVGIDLDVVPAAADSRLLLDPDADLLVVVPERDAHPVTRALATRLRRPAEVVAVDGDWRR